jgi:4-diphosphocytidyl-2-C-methyl-D-erythritol kinase
MLEIPVMTRTFRSFAKINLELEVVGRRADGYHELRTLFQSVALHDLISMTRSERGVGLSVEGAELSSGPDNLVHQAATGFLERWGEGGVDLVLEKRVPIGGGLGGGSSNAATALLGLRQLFGAPARVADMEGLAAGLGADVPFFLVGGTAYGTGRGDRVEPLEDLEEQEIWLANPGQLVSTADVFSHLDLEALKTARGAGTGTEVQEPVSIERASGVRWPVDAAGRNDLEATVLALFPAVSEVYTALVQSGAQRVGVSGSGGSMFAFYDSPPDPRELEQGMPEGSLLFRSQTLSRASIARRLVVEPEGED